MNLQEFEEALENINEEVLEEKKEIIIREEFFINNVMEVEMKVDETHVTRNEMRIR